MGVKEEVLEILQKVSNKLVDLPQANVLEKRAFVVLVLFIGEFLSIIKSNYSVDYWLFYGSWTLILEILFLLYSFVDICIRNCEVCPLPCCQCVEVISVITLTWCHLVSWVYIPLYLTLSLWSHFSVYVGQWLWSCFVLGSCALMYFLELAPSPLTAPP